MGFVNCDERDGDLLEPLDELLIGKALGCDVEEFILADVLHELGNLKCRQAAIEKGGVESAFGKACDLVLHERDERRDNNGSPWKDHCRELVADRFSSACRQDRYNILLFQNSGDDLFLVLAKLVVAKKGFELVFQIHRNEGNRFPCSFQ